MPLKKKSKKATENVVEKSVVEVPEEVKKLPTVDDSPELKKIAEASQKVERMEKKKKNTTDSETETEAESELPVSEIEPKVPEVTKMKPISKKEMKASKKFLSLDSETGEDSSSNDERK